MTFYTKLEKVFETIEYGKANLNVTIHNGKPAFFVSDEFSTKRYKKNSMVDSTKDILTELKVLVEDNHSGTVSFTMEMNNGVIKQLHIHKAKKHYINKIDTK